MSFRICTDIGGTFTDLAIVDEKGRVGTFKTPATPGDYIGGEMLRVFRVLVRS